MIDIKKILGEDYLSKFRVFHQQTLFDPAWENLKKDRCPLCGCKLYIPRGRSVVMCKSVKHGRPFVIGLDKLNKIKNKKNERAIKVQVL